MRCDDAPNVNGTPNVTPWTQFMTFDDLRIMDRLEELRGCDKRLTACMLDRLGDLRRELCSACWLYHACI